MFRPKALVATARGADSFSRGQVEAMSAVIESLDSSCGETGVMDSRVSRYRPDPVVRPDEKTATRIRHAVLVYRHDRPQGGPIDQLTIEPVSERQLAINSLDRRDGLGSVHSADRLVHRTDTSTSRPSGRRTCRVDDTLVSAVATDLDFAHRSGAALAMMPAAQADEAGDKPVELLLDVYTEVVNVLARLVNEATPSRVRLDPGLQHSDEALQQIIEKSSPIISCTVTIAGYGTGQLGVWYRGD